MKLSDLGPVRFAFNADPVSGTPLESPARIPLLAGLIAAGMFAAFAAVWIVQFRQINLHEGGMFGLMSTLFSVFWLMGWSIGVLLLGALTAFIFLFRQSAYINSGLLVSAAKAGPFSLLGEYDLSRIRNLRIEENAGGKTVNIRFDYDGKGQSLGFMMQPDAAARNLKVLQAAVASAPSSDAAAMPMTPPPAAAPEPVAIKTGPVPVDAERRGLPLPSMLALIGANLIPLYMVLWAGWTLGQVMMLFWAESAVIGFYTLLKMAVVAKWWAIFPGVFFLGHFGGFMAIHFLFIYMLFLGGTHAGMPDPAALPELVRLFAPLQLALLALVVSHGVSFVMNFLMQREYDVERVQSLMTAPYGRIIVMHLTLIFGGWVVMLLHDPAPVLALLIVFKIIADLRGHYGEHAPVK